MLSSQNVHDERGNNTVEKQSRLSMLEAEIDDAVFGRTPTRYNAMVAARPPITRLQGTLAEDMTLSKPTNKLLHLQSKPASRSMSKPTIILVHGGWQTASAYNHLAAYLRSTGYKVLIPSLPSTITRPAVESGEPDISAIRNCILQETDSGRDAVLVAHSYGAVVSCEVLNSVPLKHKGGKGCIVRLGFIAGWIPEIGDSIWPKEKNTRWLPGFVMNVSLYCFHPGVSRHPNLSCAPIWLKNLKLTTCPNRRTS